MYSCLLGLLLTATGVDPQPFPPPTVVPAVLPCPAPIAPCDFARAFTPAPGRYEVVFLHPTKCCPVKVCFTLPAGCAKVCCTKHKLVFDYGCQSVVIRFKIIGGGVRVLYN